ncbi:MAG: YifB family Mg chelatase-like AAA ATPase [Eubacteriales bacterium]
MYCTVTAGALSGLHSFFVQVEVCVTNGLPYIEMVGSLSNEVREAKERVKIALQSSNVAIPPRRVTINLAPANVKKEGNGYDLPIAVGILCALEQIPVEVLRGKLFIGELSLNGQVKGVHGILPLVLQLKEQGITEFIIPTANVGETQMITGCKVTGVDNICEVIAYLQGKSTKEDTCVNQEEVFRQLIVAQEYKEQKVDFLDIAGQESVKRAVCIAAAGFHNLLMTGPPGAGKSMIAHRIPTILPPLTLEESLEVSQIYSIKGMLGDEKPLVGTRPFLNPHHTISAQALAGGGRIPQPGIVSLAHKGVLFLDELPEFHRNALEILRQPMEEKVIHIARTHGNYTYPAEFMLVGAMNPCPCGYYPDHNKCTCKESDVKRYSQKISGPLLDRMDLCVSALPVSIAQLTNHTKRTSSKEMREHVLFARKIQEKRYQEDGIVCNGQLIGALVEKYCSLKADDQMYVEAFFEKMQLSARGYHRLLKVARTIADMEGSETIERIHLVEAICYRMDETITSRMEGE